MKLFTCLVFLPFALLVALAVGCSADGQRIVEEEMYSLHRIEDCDELLDLHRRGTLSSPAYYLEQNPREDGWDPPPASDPHHLIRSTWQRLNTRLNGVEEADLAKTDGTYIFSMTTQSLVISKPTSGTGVKMISNVRLRKPDKYAGHHLPLRSELILHNGTVLAVRSWHNFFGSNGWHGDSIVQIFEINVNNPSNPAIVRELELFNTELLAAWLIDDQVRIAFWHFAPVATLRSDWQMEGESDPQAAARSYNEALVGDLDLSHWQPRYQLREQGDKPGGSGPVVSCVDTYIPVREYWQPYGTYMMAFDLTDGIGAWESAAVLLDYYRIHATADNLYFVRSSLYPERNTQIYQFELSSGAVPMYRAAKFLMGNLPMAASLDEHEGVLRVAYTGVGSDTEQWGGRVVVLQPSDGSKQGATMDEKGSVFLGDEEIRYVRWWRDTAYISPWIGYEEVTRPDPLHVLDLSDPEQPNLVATVDIPELSRNYYIRSDPAVPAWRRGDLLRLSAEFAISVGFSSDVYERTPEDTTVALIDLSDPLAPRLASVVSFPGSYSALEYDDRATLLEGDNIWLAGPGCFGIELCGSTFVGLELSAGTLVHRHTVVVDGASLGPPGVRALLLGGQLHVISGTEIRTFDSLSATELGSLSLPR